MLLHFINMLLLDQLLFAPPVWANGGVYTAKALAIPACCTNDDNTTAIFILNTELVVVFDIVTRLLEIGDNGRATTYDYECDEYCENRFSVNKFANMIILQGCATHYMTCGINRIFTVNSERRRPISIKSTNYYVLGL